MRKYLGRNLSRYAFSFQTQSLYNAMRDDFAMAG
jgi:hypothetical protein